MGGEGQTGSESDYYFLFISFLVIPKVALFPPHGHILHWIKRGNNGKLMFQFRYFKGVWKTRNNNIICKLDL